MAELVPVNKVLQTGPDATVDERAAIKTLIEKAQGVCPGVRVRFVQREQDLMGTLLIVGMETADPKDTENYALHAVAHDLEEQSGINLIVTQSSIPTQGKQLLKVREFLSPDKISSEALEPTELTNVVWRPAHQRYKGVLIAFVVGALMVAAYVASFEWLQQTFPALFRGSEPSKFEHRTEGVRGVRLNIDESIRHIDEQIEKREPLSLTEKQVEELRSEKSLLEKARKDLEQPAPVP